MFNILLERNLQGVGAGCPYMLEDKLSGRKTTWSKREILLEFYFSS